MKPLIILTISLVFLSSCATLHFSAEKKATVKDLSIDWTFSKSVDREYIPNIDSVMTVVIANYNSHSHSFKVHKKLATEPEGLTINFSRGKFTGDGEITASYLVSAIGLIAAPITMYSASNGQGLLFFWYFPSDCIRLKTSLSPELAGNNGKTVVSFIQKGATFSRKSARMARMCNGINDYVSNILLKLDSSTESE